MARKKTKKHKKERSRSSISSCDDRRKDDIGTFDSPRGKSKHEHFPSHAGGKQKPVKGTGSSRSLREESPKKETWKKPEGKNNQAKVTGNTQKVTGNRVYQDHRTLYVPVKHLPLGHGVHAVGKSNQTSSRHGLEASSKELEGRRKALVKRSAPEEPRQKSAEAAVLPGGEKRKEIVKRRSSTQEDYPAAKQRTTEASATASMVHQELSQKRKKMAERSSRNLGIEVLSKVQHVSCSKTGDVHSRERLSPVRHPAWSFTPKAPRNGNSETPGSERQKGSAVSTTSGGELTSCPRLPVSFRIPKKLSAAKAQINTDVIVRGKVDRKAGVSGKHTPQGRVMVASPPANTGPGHSAQRPAQVPSPPSDVPHKSPHFHQAQLMLREPVRERSSPSTSSTLAWAEHAVGQVASTECTEAVDSDQEVLWEDVYILMKNIHVCMYFCACHCFAMHLQMQLVEELHLARFDRRLTVNVTESYGELTCMDVDPPEEGVNRALNVPGPFRNSQGEEQKDLLIVLDTNILLSHLDFVKKMRSHGLGGLGGPTLLVPWVVLQELDALKSGKLSLEVERKARPAVHYIYSCLKNQEPRLWGQSLQQASQAARGLAIENNDDRVLQCCLQYQTLHPEGSLILCTNDKNLCSKALLSGVKALSKADLVDQAALKPRLLNHSYNLHAATTSAGPNQEAQERRKQPREEEEVVVSRVKVPGAECELSVCVSALESSLQGVLSVVLEEEMKDAFGDLWTEIVYLKPPWTLQAVLQCFRKHWIAVFGNIIKRNLLSCVETLSTTLCSGMVVERGTVLTAARAAEDLLVALSCRSSYGGRVNVALSHLRDLQGRTGPQLLKTPAEVSSDDDSVMLEAVEDIAPPTQASHQEVWALFESIWNNVCQASSAVFSALDCPPGSAGLTQSHHTPPPQDALSCLHGLSAALTQLLNVFRRLASVDSTVEDARALLTLIHAHEMATLEPCITARDLLECLSLQEYRQKLCVGGTQLMELKANLDRCAAAVCGTGGGSS